MKNIIQSCFFYFCCSHFAFADPFKVISLSPHTTELAYEAGLGEYLIAVSEHSDYPPEAQKLEQVANFKGINIERVIALQPDLVLAWKGGNPDKELAKIARFGIEIFYSNPHSLEDTADNIEKLGLFSKKPELAASRAAKLRQTLKSIRQAYQHKSKVPYFYQVDSHPLMTNNDQHWPQPLFSLCGGLNIFADSKAPYPQISMEQVVTKQPQAIFFSSVREHPSYPWNAWQEHIPALKNNAIFTISADWLNRPTPRAIRAVEQICAALDRVRQKLNY